MHLYQIEHGLRTRNKKHTVNCSIYNSVMMIGDMHRVYLSKGLIFAFAPILTRFGSTHSRAKSLVPTRTLTP